MRYTKSSWLIIMLALSLVLSACNFGQEPEPTPDVGAIFTAAAETVVFTGINPNSPGGTHYHANPDQYCSSYLCSRKPKCRYSVSSRNSSNGYAWSRGTTNSSYINVSYPNSSPGDKS